jgi:hypothetical protein
MNIIWPYKEQFVRVNISPEGDLDNECIKELLEFVKKKYELIIFSVENGSNQKRHAHIIIPRVRTDNITRTFKPIVSKYHQICTGITIKTVKYRKDVGYFVGSCSKKIPHY